MPRSITISPLTKISLFRPPCSSWHPQFHSVSMSLAILDSIHKWELITFVFLCLTFSLSTLPSKLIHVTKGRASFFFFNPFWKILGYYLFLLVLFFFSGIIIAHTSNIFNLCVSFMISSVFSMSFFPPVLQSGYFQVH